MQDGKQDQNNNTRVWAVAVSNTLLTAEWQETLDWALQQEVIYSSSENNSPSGKSFCPFTSWNSKGEATQSLQAPPVAPNAGLWNRLQLQSG